MDESTCPVRVSDGGTCGRASFDETLPFPLCGDHYFAVRRWDYREAAAQLRARSPQSVSSPENPIVYYVRVGERIKIGTTVKTVRQRFQGQLPPDAQVLATEPGSYDVERRRHRQFRHLQDANEWFRPGSELWRHIAQLRETFGQPDDLTTV
jgi:hypothetical protein